MTSSDKQGKLVVLTIEEIQQQLSKASTELMAAKSENVVKTWIGRISNAITHLEEYPTLGDETHALYQTVEDLKLGDKTRSDILVAINDVMNAIVAFIDEEKKRKAKAEKVKQALLLLAENVEIIMPLLDKK